MRSILDKIIFFRWLFEPRNLEAKFSSTVLPLPRVWPRCWCLQDYINLLNAGTTVNATCLLACIELSCRWWGEVRGDDDDSPRAVRPAGNTTGPRRSGRHLSLIRYHISCGRPSREPRKYTNLFIQLPSQCRWGTREALGRGILHSARLWKVKRGDETSRQN